MATHCSILACRIPWREESGGLQSIGSQSWTGLKWLSMHSTHKLLHPISTKPMYPSLRTVLWFQNCSEISSHTGQNGHHQKIYNAGEGVGKTEPSYTVGGNVNWCSHYGEQYGDFLKFKNRATIWASNPTLWHTSGENHTSKRYMHLSVHCSTVYNRQNMEAI